MATTIPEASLLGLPTELRLRIYDYVLQADINCPIVVDIVHSSDSNGTQAALIPNAEAAFSSKIPWLNLRTTCRRISHELQSYVQDSSCQKNDFNRTYVLDLEVSRHYDRGPATRTVTWRSIPCAPAQARYIIMNVITRSGPGPWTDGGSASLARAVYQVLNHAVHMGPRIFRKSLLPHHMKLQDLIINIDIGVYCSAPIRGCNTNPEINGSLFQSGWMQISRTGFWSGYLERTRLKTNGEEEVVIPTEWQMSPALPGYWRGLGFQWGITGLQCANYFTL
ncbi:uncharacterized protein LTR77_002357 [Saxophila tyrrhenica]|uniref:Uncharacterized protein n=1 Tax=Saxophila tyrrhenica TaxID=1690608 RepID=A0AAV9PK37_9PEZI|nr:hypothetical protein LTR77_002357 [Saxophila tyrrhenica]